MGRKKGFDWRLTFDHNNIDLTLNPNPNYIKNESLFIQSLDFYVVSRVRWNKNNILFSESKRLYWQQFIQSANTDY